MILRFEGDIKPAITGLLALGMVGFAALAQSPSMTPTPLQSAPTDPTLLSIRQARSALFDNLFGESGHPMGPALENLVPRTPAPRTTHQLMQMDELPAAFADTIVLGQLTNIQAYQSNNHTAIYTESTLQVQQVISQEIDNISAGGTLVFEQVGGSITAPGGRILSHVSSGLGEPLQKGQLYVLFLTFVPNAQCYKLTKGWWLQSGTARAMSPDDLVRVRNGASQYDGMPENQFIGALKLLQASYKGK